MRRVIAFPCGGDTLVGTLDEGTASTGLLIVSGGNEVRAGAHRGMAALARRIAAKGVPVFRYDRRGIGDATGENRGWEGSADDLAAAAAAFRGAASQLTRIVGFGNCDAATTLALYGTAAEIDALVLANPWVVEPVDDLPPAPAIRARYARQLRDPATWRRLLTGKVDLRRLLRGVLRAAAPITAAPGLAARVLAALDGRAVTIVLAKHDNTARAYAAAAMGTVLPTVTIDTSSHSFARPADAAALTAAVLAAVCPAI